jgi:hypothetical protein
LPSTLQRRLALSSQPYSISISYFISALKALDKPLDAWASRYKHFFALVFKDNPLRYEKDLYLPSTKFEDSFHVNMKIFEIYMTQSHFHRNGVPPPKEWLCKEATSSFLQVVQPIKQIRL